MDGHLSDNQNLLKNRQKPDLLTAHYKQHFKSTTSHTKLRRFMVLKVVKQIIIFGAMI